MGGGGATFGVDTPNVALVTVFVSHLHLCAFLHCRCKFNACMCDQICHLQYSDVHGTNQALVEGVGGVCWYTIDH